MSLAIFLMLCFVLSHLVVAVINVILSSIGSWFAWQARAGIFREAMRGKRRKRGED